MDVHGEDKEIFREIGNKVKIGEIDEETKKKPEYKLAYTGFNGLGKRIY